jgi:hypothetical protein
MAIDQTFITLKFSDRKGASVGTATLCLSWANQPEAVDDPNVNKWFIWNSSTGFDTWLMSWGGMGLFDVKSWGVMWLWDQDSTASTLAVRDRQHNNLILHDAPTDRWDNKHLAGRGRVYDPRNAQGKYLAVRWATFWSDNS